MLQRSRYMSKTYLVNSFSINMLKDFPISVVFDKLDEQEFCVRLDIRLDEGELINAVGHDSTINLINKLCGVELTKNRVEVKLERGDVALVVMINDRLPEGRVLGDEELMDMLSQGKIAFYEVIL
jgi:hypothetical protein